MKIMPSVFVVVVIFGIVAFGAFFDGLERERQRRVEFERYAARVCKHAGYASGSVSRLYLCPGSDQPYLLQDIPVGLEGGAK